MKTEFKRAKNIFQKMVIRQELYILFFFTWRDSFKSGQQERMGFRVRIRNCAFPPFFDFSSVFSNVLVVVVVVVVEVGGGGVVIFVAFIIVFVVISGIQVVLSSNRLHILKIAENAGGCFFGLLMDGFGGRGMVYPRPERGKDGFDSGIKSRRKI